MSAAPSGVVSFLLTDVEGSTGLWEGDESAMDLALARHDSVMRAAIATNGGYVFSTAGDSFAAAFTSPTQAVAAAIEAQRALTGVGLRARMAVHLGEAHERDGDYFGPTVNRAARLMRAAHGGQVLVSEPVAALVGERVTLVHLGEHRLRDVTAPMQIWQVAAPGLENVFPPLRTPGEARGSLPPQRTAVFGRDDEVHGLVAKLQETPLVTVTGSGGVGKTTLAVQAAGEALSDFPGGAWFAPLATVESGDAVGDVVLTAVGARRQAGRSALATLRELASAHRLLVVLDNCEHVVDAAADCADAIVSGGRSVVVATSREPLGIAGEHVVPVSTLDEDAAVALFADRARAVDPSFVINDRDRMLVGEICRRLDGLPLALELAAARVRSMSLGELADRLDARFRLLSGGGRGVAARHRTLQAAIAWSYDLLAPNDRAMFNALSVFPGEFTANAAAAVAAGGDPVDALDAALVLDSLVRRSMVVADRTRAATRYALLETLRQFGSDHLDASNDAHGRRARHAFYFLRVAEDARRQLSTPRATAAMTAFVDEWDNLRAAFEWLASSGDVDGALRLVVACQWFATLHLHYELLPWAERAVELDGATDHHLFAAAVATAALIRGSTGDLSGSERLAIEALRHEEASGSAPRFEPACALALAYWRSSQTERLVEATVTVERIAARTQDPLELGQAWLTRSIAFVATGLVGVGTSTEDAIRDAERTANPYHLAYAYAGALSIAAQDHNVEAARHAYAEARRWADVAGHRYISMLAPMLMAMALSTDHPLDGTPLIREVLVSIDETAHWELLAPTLRRVVVILVRLGHHRRAALLLGGSTGPLSSSPDTQDVVPSATAALQQAIGDDFPRLLEEGRRLTRHDLVRRALDDIDTCLKDPQSPGETNDTP